MPKYIKRPVLVDAIEWTGDNEGAIDEFLGDDRNFIFSYTDGEPTLTIYISENPHDITVGNFIVRGGVPGEIRVYDSADSTLLYEPIEEGEEHA